MKGNFEAGKDGQNYWNTPKIFEFIDKEDWHLFTNKLDSRELRDWGPTLWEHERSREIMKEARDETAMREATLRGGQEKRELQWESARFEVRFRLGL